MLSAFRAAFCTLALLTAPSATRAQTAQITIDPKPGPEIHRDLFGANYDWNKVDGSRAPAWVAAMKRAGVQLVLYPGGWNPEHYDWATNSEPAWHNRRGLNDYDPAVQPAGLSPSDIISLIPTAIVTPSLKATEEPESIGAVAKLSADLVRRYGDKVKRWDIGNEWWLTGGARRHEDIRHIVMQRYADLIKAAVPLMKRARSDVSIFVSADWQDPQQYAVLRGMVGPEVWSQLAGVSVHTYCNTTSLKCSDVPAAIEKVRQASGKTRIFDSQWFVRRNGTPDNFGVHNANYLTLAIDDLAKAGIEAAIIWPVTDFLPGLNFVSPDYQVVYASGLLYRWMSDDFRGHVLTTSGDVRAAASMDGTTVSLFVPSLRDGPLDVRVSLGDLDLNRVLSASVMYSETQNSPFASRLVKTAPLKVAVDGGVASFSLNPGGDARGSGWEIAKITLGR